MDTVVSTLFNSGYNYFMRNRVTTENDQYITLADTALRWFSEASVPGRYWVDLFPWRTSFVLYSISYLTYILVRYVPEWFPWTSWKNDGKAGFEVRRRMYNEPFLQAKTKAVSLTQFLKTKTAYTNKISLIMLYRLALLAMFFQKL